MATDPGPFHKLWWHGVDIAANFITGLALAILAIASWRFQQWWQRRIEVRHRAEDELRSGRKRLLETLYFLQRNLHAENGINLFPHLDGLATAISLDEMLSKTPEFTSFLGFWNKNSSHFPRYASSLILNWTEMSTLSQQVGSMEAAARGLRF